MPADRPFERLDRNDVAARPLQTLQSPAKVARFALSQIRSQPRDDTLHLVRQPGQLGSDAGRQLAVSGHALRADLIEGDIDEAQRHPYGMRRSEHRSGDLNALAREDSNHLGAHPGDVILDDLGLRGRDVGFVLGEWRLGLRGGQDSLDFGKKLVGVLAARQKVTALRGVQTLAFPFVVHCAHLGPKNEDRPRPAGLRSGAVPGRS